MPRFHVLTLCCATIGLAAPSTCFAGDVPPIQLQASAGGGASDWRGDASIGSGLKIGYRPVDIFTVFFLGRLSYGTVDERLLTLVSIGGQFNLPLEDATPYLRLALAHQHEEPLVNVDAGALLGIGDGIRHRGGFEAGLGVEFPLYEMPGVEVVGGAEAWLDWLVAGFGPEIFAGGGLTLGIGFDV